MSHVHGRAYKISFRNPWSKSCSPSPYLNFKKKKKSGVPYSSESGCIQFFNGRDEKAQVHF